MYNSYFNLLDFIGTTATLISWTFKNITAGYSRWQIEMSQAWYSYNSKITDVVSFFYYWYNSYFNLLDR